jgi:uncharacterized protein (TIGR03086 family)
MNDLDALSAAVSEFRSRLTQVDAADLSKPTPCTEWDIAALIEHVNRGNRMAELLLHGADKRTSVGDAAAPPPDVDDLTTFDVTAAGQHSAFEEDGAMERAVDHPASPMPGSLLLMFRTADLALHAIDLASALGTDTTIDGELVDSIWGRLEPLVPILGPSGVFGSPPDELPADASPREKLLLATGR